MASVNDLITDMALSHAECRVGIFILINRVRNQHKIAASCHVSLRAVGEAVKLLERLGYLNHEATIADTTQPLRSAIAELPLDKEDFPSHTLPIQESQSEEKNSKSNLKDDFRGDAGLVSALDWSKAQHEPWAKTMRAHGICIGPGTCDYLKRLWDEYGPKIFLRAAALAVFPLKKFPDVIEGIIKAHERKPYVSPIDQYMPEERPLTEQEKADDKAMYDHQRATKTGLYDPWMVEYQAKALLDRVNRNKNRLAD